MSNSIKSHASTQQHNYIIHPVLLYIPNLIGYSRVLLTTISFILCWTSPILSGILYGISQVLDALDGTAARYYNQTSSFGAVLDMLTDRMSTGVLFIVLSLMYPNVWGLFAFLLVLDMCSHWFQMYSRLSSGQTTHKGARNKWLNFYYTFPYALLVHVIGNEAFFLSLYILYFDTYTLPVWLLSTAKIAALISLPICTAKQIMNVIQLWESIQILVEQDYKRVQPQYQKVT